MRWVEISSLAETIERNAGLPNGMLRALCATENGAAQHSGRSFSYAEFDPFARRVEPEFYSRYVAGTHWEATQWGKVPEVIAASYGLTQVMYTTAVWAKQKGLFVAAWDGTPWKLFDPLVNMTVGASVFAYKAKRYKSWAAGASAYNAGSPRTMASGIYENQSYVDKIRDNLGGDWPRMNGVA